MQTGQKFTDTDEAEPRAHARARRCTGAPSAERLEAERDAWRRLAEARGRIVAAVDGHAHAAELDARVEATRDAVDLARLGVRL